MPLFNTPLLMRLFIGIELPDKIKNSIGRYVESLQVTAKGWENPNDYHLTLLFLGETQAEVVGQIIKRLDFVTFNSFELELKGLEFFPRRVLYLGLEQSLELLALKNLTENLFPEWLRPEAKEFTPHITLKRWQRYEFNFLAAAIHSQNFGRLKFKVSGLALFKSERDLQNHKYHVIHRVVFR